MTQRRAWTALLALLLAAGIATPALGQPAEPPAYVEDSRYIESADGTRLAVSVFRPRSPGRYPVLVTQDRGEGGDRTRLREFFVRHGYVIVAQDRRGTGASFGTQTGFVNRADVADAKAVIEWAAGQPFSTGAVGAMGCSNQGVWQYGVAALQPNGLKAIAPACASPAFFDDAVTLNGVPMFALKPSFYQADCPTPPATAPAPPPARQVATDRDGTLLREALAQRGCTAPMLGQYWLNMPRDGWNAYALYRPAIDDTPITHWQAIKGSGVAVLQLGGWFDAAVAGQLHSQSLWGGKVVMGPWTHGNRVPRGASFADGQRDLEQEMLRWFAHYLKGEGPAPAAGIEYYVINAAPGSEWRTTTAWPAAARKTRFHFDRTALSEEPARASTATIAGEGVQWFEGQYAPLARWSTGDMASADAASLVHTTAPLPAAAELIGTPTARLWVTSVHPDLNVYAVIEDVAPDGRATYVTDGRIRASWRALAPSPWGAVHGHWHRGLASDLQALEPGKPAELVFDFFPIAYRFAAGHRIRVALTTSIGEAYQQPPSTGGALPTATLLRGGEHASAIELPLQPTP
jgi:putative CocE/NonD family hydrolase